MLLSLKLQLCYLCLYTITVFLVQGDGSVEDDKPARPISEPKELKNPPDGVQPADEYVELFEKDLVADIDEREAYMGAKIYVEGYLEGIGWGLLDVLGYCLEPPFPVMEKTKTGVVKFKKGKHGKRSYKINVKGSGVCGDNSSLVISYVSACRIKVTLTSKGDYLHQRKFVPLNKLNENPAMFEHCESKCTCQNQGQAVPCPVKRANVTKVSSISDVQLMNTLDQITSKKSKKDEESSKSRIKIIDGLQEGSRKKEENSEVQNIPNPEEPPSSLEELPSKPEESPNIPKESPNPEESPNIPEDEPTDPNEPAPEVFGSGSESISKHNRSHKKSKKTHNKTQKKHKKHHKETVRKEGGGPETNQNVQPVTKANMTTTTMTTTTTRRTTTKVKTPPPEPPSEAKNNKIKTEKLDEEEDMEMEETNSEEAEDENSVEEKQVVKRLTKNQANQQEFTDEVLSNERVQQVAKESPLIAGIAKETQK